MIVQRTKDHFVAYVDRREVGSARTLTEALRVYVDVMKRETGETIDPRTVMVFQYMPHEPVYKLLRIR